MATVKAVLRKKKNPEGRYPIAIRITKDRKSSYLGTGQHIEEKYWDEKNRCVRKSHPNANIINNFILAKVAEANKKVLEAENNADYQTVKAIKKNIRQNKKVDFFAVANMHLENLKNREKHHQYDTELGRLKKFKGFLKKNELSFNELNVPLLKRFEAYLLHNKKRSPRTVVNYLILIRTIYNLAISESLVDRGRYPFGKGKVQIKIPESQKIGLNRKEIQKLENATDLTEAQKKAVHVWLISFYFAGIRVGDVLKLKWSDFNDGRLMYRMNKNSKLVTLKTPDKASAILDRYRENYSLDNDLIFHYLKDTDLNDSQRVSVRTQGITRNLNRHLKKIAYKLGITKKMSMHIARHSFGNISGDKIPIQMLQKLYRHSSVTTTINYQANFIHKDADDALDSVINF
ncbi:phage integrase SAM-like domain-containing protein [Leeuwenhoekiella polynyae]|uniref:Site-specific recombinase XerD n=3 Tax=Leeuwenhoekiella TaxID=283735 RepID=A0A4Q0PKF6_9FLAO|nr:MULTISPECIES: site-specific integrase [Leeuwenhoekiella]RXG25716.1 site-specific recombinase XerD [Leeuwenhoekiella polynyae]RXG27949.1 site-specific recombinase XerD [Leeuwenhoekiella marinoflava]SHF60435.1 Site-specific recombinase XerD [Leeuwenhoekiella marinoflava DSM 3653]